MKRQKCKEFTVVTRKRRRANLITWRIRLIQGRSGGFATHADQENITIQNQEVWKKYFQKTVPGTYLKQQSQTYLTLLELRQQLPLYGLTAPCACRQVRLYNRRKAGGRIRSTSLIQVYCNHLVLELAPLGCSIRQMSVVTYARWYVFGSEPTQITSHSILRAFVAWNVQQV